MHKEVDKLKSYRSFRVKVEDGDKLKFELYLNNSCSVDKSERLPVEGVTLSDISITGFGIFSSSLLNDDTQYYVKIMFRHETLDCPVNITREEKVHNEYGECEKYFYGIQVNELNINSCKVFMSRYISSFSHKRLKSQLSKLLLNEKELNTENFDNNFHLFLSLIQDMREFSKNDYFIENICKETARNLNALTYNLYLLENGKDEFKKCFFDKGKENNSFFKSQIVIKDELLEEGNSILTFSKKHNKLDSFLKDHFDNCDELIDVLIVPIKNYSGVTKGFILFSKASSKESFNERDENTANLLAALISTLALEDEIQEETEENDEVINFNNNELVLIGNSDCVIKMKKFIRHCSLKSTNLLIEGEAGSGKSHLSKIIHKNSERSSMGCGYVDCSLLSENMSLEDLLLGNNSNVGRFDLYSGGTLIFDQINLLNMKDQKLLAKLLKTREDIRFIATTALDLEKSIIEGNFYKQLFESFNQDRFYISPLRKRKEDILLLANHFIKKYCSFYGHILKDLDPKLKESILEHRWPSNVSELELAVKRMIIYNPSSHILYDDNNDVLPIFHSDKSLEHNYRNIINDYKENLSCLSETEIESLLTAFIIEKYLEQNPLEVIQQAADHYHLKREEVVSLLKYKEEYFDINRSLELIEEKKVG